MAVLVMASAAALVMVGCQSRAAEERAVADRLDAEAGLALAEADAYQRRVEANTSAEAERMLQRELARDSSHERVLETVMLFLAGAIMIVVGGATGSFPLAGVGVVCILGELFLVKTKDKTGCGTNCFGLLVALAVGLISIATVMYYGARL